jgi:hypothetical protein
MVSAVISQALFFDRNAKSKQGKSLPGGATRVKQAGRKRV